MNIPKGSARLAPARKKKIGGAGFLTRGLGTQRKGNNMWVYEKKLQYPINIKNPNPALAKIIITQYGGPHARKICLFNYKRKIVEFFRACGKIT